MKGRWNDWNMSRRGSLEGRTFRATVLEERLKEVLTDNLWLYERVLLEAIVFQAR